MTEYVVVDFHGTRGGSGALSWGQVAIWRAIQRLVPDDAMLNMSWITALEDEGISERTPLPRITETVSQIMARYESLRTLVRIDPDAQPYQVVVASGQITLEVVDASRDGAAAAAAALQDRLTVPVFDYGTAWPLRVGAVRAGGVITHAVFAICHLTTDRGGLDTLVRDVLELLAGRAPTAAPASQPLDQARHQTSLAGRRESSKALRYWARQLRAVPADRFSQPATPAAGEPPFWSATLHSAAADQAISLIATRARVSSSAVILAAAAFRLAPLATARTAVVQVIVSNRFRPGLAGSVSPTAQDGLCVIDVGDAGFDEVIARAATASLQAYLHSQYDPVELDRLLADLGAERGADADLSCSFNDRRFESQTPPTAGADVTEAGLRAALPDTTLSWEPLQRYGARYFLHVNAAPGAMELTLFADATVLPAATIEAYLRGIESLLVDTALDALAGDRAGSVGTDHHLDPVG